MIECSFSLVETIVHYLGWLKGNLLSADNFMHMQCILAIFILHYLLSFSLAPADPFLYPNNSLSRFPVFWLLVCFRDSLNLITVAKSIGGCYLLELGELNRVYTWEHHHAYIIGKCDSPKSLTASTSSEKGGVSRTRPLSLMEFWPVPSCAGAGKHSCCSPE